MIVVSVLYPNTPGTTFDLDYYRDRHLPLVRELLEPGGMRSLSYYVPGPAEADPPYRLVAELRFDSMAEVEAGMAEHGAVTQADIVNFTDVEPVILVGEETQA
jgi:uncharacterized protein (TIGR02118 family)